MLCFFLFSFECSSGHSHSDSGIFVAGTVIDHDGHTKDTLSKLGIGITADATDFVRVSWCSIVSISIFFYLSLQMSFWDNVPLRKIFPGASSHVCGLASKYEGEVRWVHFTEHQDAYYYIAQRIILCTVGEAIQVITFLSLFFPPVIHFILLQLDSWE